MGGIVGKDVGRYFLSILLGGLGSVATASAWQVGDGAPIKTGFEAI